MMTIPDKPRLRNPAPGLWRGWPRPQWDYFNAPGRSGYNPYYANPGDPVGHKGLDLGANEGSPAVAALAGRVHFLIDPRFNPSAGWGVETVTPADGGHWGCRYLHLVEGSILVSPTDMVTVGQEIAKVGKTGNANYPHIHFECRWIPDPLGPDSLVNQGIPLDPMGFDILTATVPVVWPHMLYPGNDHPCVRPLRGLLHTLGYLPTLGGTTVYNDRVQTAVKQFQTEHPPLIPNGLVGPQTRAAIAQAVGQALNRAGTP